MSEEVKFIFKSLIKVPVIIIVSFAILNIFSFFFIYFKVLGMSYVVMQVAVENNYLPQNELSELANSIYAWNDIPMVEDARIVVDTDSAGLVTMANETDFTPLTSTDARNRRQYGGTVTCGIKCNYVIVWPLSYVETTRGDTGVNGLNGDAFTGFKGERELNIERNDDKHRVVIPINIVYTVPGLKYYPDMLT